MMNETDLLHSNTSSGNITYTALSHFSLCFQTMLWIHFTKEYKKIQIV